MVLQQRNKVCLAQWAEQESIGLCPKVLECLVGRREDCLCQMCLSIVDYYCDLRVDQAGMECLQIGIRAQQVGNGVG